jgi:hypothetical protein
MRLCVCDRHCRKSTLLLWFTFQLSSMQRVPGLLSSTQRIPGFVEEYAKGTWFCSVVRKGYQVLLSSTQRIPGFVE